jgi:hypothetical protein
VLGLDTAYHEEQEELNTDEQQAQAAQDAKTDPFPNAGLYRSRKRRPKAGEGAHRGWQKLDSNYETAEIADDSV